VATQSPTEQDHACRALSPPEDSLVLPRPSRLALVLGAAASAALAAPLAAPVGAQEKPQPFFISLDGKEPKRPKIEAGADTNDAHAYIEWGNLRDTPWKKSFDAYYWALRLEPNEPIHYLRLFNAVYWAQSQGWRREYASGAEFATKSKEARLLDSLITIVNYREPFAHFTSTGCTVSRDWLDYVEGDPYLTAEHYYEQGCWTQAAQWYAKTIAKYPKHLRSRLNLVRSLHYTGQHGLALAQIDTAITQIRAMDAKRTSRYYVSKEQLETMRGDIHVQTQDFFNAKKAYGKALEENLSYWPAHVRLARLASIQEEHAEALQEYDQAVQLAGSEPSVHFDYGLGLLRADKSADAEREFRKVIELEPHFALGYFNLGLALDRQGKKDEAAASYKSYLARAPKRQGKMVNLAQQRLAILLPTLTAEKK
jgi:tetratricopeptide (TPR) repeat protein